MADFSTPTGLPPRTSSEATPRRIRSSRTPLVHVSFSELAGTRGEFLFSEDWKIWEALLDAWMIGGRKWRVGVVFFFSELIDCWRTLVVGRLRVSVIFGGRKWRVRAVFFKFIHCSRARMQGVNELVVNTQRCNSRYLRENMSRRYRKIFCYFALGFQEKRLRLFLKYACT